MIPRYYYTPAAESATYKQAMREAKEEFDLWEQEKKDARAEDKQRGRDYILKRVQTQDLRLDISQVGVYI